MGEAVDHHHRHKALLSTQVAVKSRVTYCGDKSLTVSIGGRITIAAIRSRAVRQRHTVQRAR